MTAALVGGAHLTAAASSVNLFLLSLFHGHVCHRPGSEGFWGSAFLQLKKDCMWMGSGKQQGQALTGERSKQDDFRDTREREACR